MSPPSGTAASSPCSRVRFGGAAWDWQGLQGSVLCYPHVDHLRGRCASVSDFLFVIGSCGDRDLVFGWLSLEYLCRKDTEPRAEGPRGRGLIDKPPRPRLGI